MEGYKLIWTEDDAPLADREQISEAFERITGIEFHEWLEDIETIENGDSFILAPKNKEDKWRVIESYSGDSLYAKDGS